MKSDFIGFGFTKPISEDLNKRLTAFINRFDEGVMMQRTMPDHMVLRFFDSEQDVYKIRKRVLKIANNAGNDLVAESYPMDLTD